MANFRILHRSLSVKDGTGVLPGPERQGEQDFRARTTPMSRRRTRRARLDQTAKGQASQLCHVSHALMESLVGLIEGHQIMQAFDVAEREAAVTMVERLPGKHHVKVGAD